MCISVSQQWAWNVWLEHNLAKSTVTKTTDNTTRCWTTYSKYKYFCTYEQNKAEIYGDRAIDKADIHTIENVQRRFTKRCTGCSNLSYAERRCKLCLPFEESIMIWSCATKSYFVLFDCKLMIFFTFNTNISTRGHPCTSCMHHNRLDIRKQFLLAVL